jgi:hypothetical protein
MTLSKPAFILISLLTAICLLSSCSEVFYQSNAVNAPLLQEKGELKASISNNNVQGAYAATNHFALMANGFWGKFEGEKGLTQEGAMMELGLGYYLPFAEHFVFDVFGGAGLGRVTQNKRDGNGVLKEFSATGNRYFFQPGVGYVTPYWEVALSPRVSYCKYNDHYSINYTDKELLDNNLNLIDDTYFLFFEPALTAKVGYKWIKLQAQYGYTLNLNNQPFSFAKDFKTIGVVINLGHWYNTKPAVEVEK